MQVMTVGESPIHQKNAQPMVVLVPTVTVARSLLGEIVVASLIHLHGIILSSPHLVNLVSAPEPGVLCLKPPCTVDALAAILMHGIARQL
jgi:hypothetical protein